MKNFLCSLVLAAAILTGVNQNNGKAEALKSSEVMLCKYNYTEIIKFDEILYLVTFDDYGNILELEPYE